jgi:hypothetical protein
MSWTPDDEPSQLSRVSDSGLEIALDPGIVDLTLRIPAACLISLVDSRIWQCERWLRKGVLPFATARRF